MAKGHIRPRGPGAWELKYDAGVDPATGARIAGYFSRRMARSRSRTTVRASFNSGVS
jgi:TctA family transporter